MTRRRLLATSIALALSACQQASDAPITTTCGAIDGDTLRCEHNLRLRLNGINSPELSTIEGLVAGSAMDSILFRFGPQVSYIPLKTDRYGRTVAEVFVNNIDLSCYMLQQHQAVYVAKWDEQHIVDRTCHE